MRLTVETRVYFQHITLPVLVNGRMAQWIRRSTTDRETRSSNLRAIESFCTIFMCLIFTFLFNVT